MDECIEVMEQVLKTLAKGDAVQPLRNLMWLPDKQGIVGVMPAYTGAPEAAGVKIVTVFPGNHGTEYDSHQGAVMLFDTKNGCLRAIAEAGEITAIRTAAVSGVATRLLAREDAGDLAILGSGVQAREHLEAVAAVRELRRVRVWSPTVKHRIEFARRETERQNLTVEPVDSAREAVLGADIICTTTFAQQPVVAGRWISPGAHINAVGSSVPQYRELDTDAVKNASFFIDRLESTLSEAGDFLIPKSEGAIDDGHIRGEIGEVLIGAKEGRTSADEITLFKSLGLAVEDVASIQHIYEKARESGVGTSIEFGGPQD